MQDVGYILLVESNSYEAEISARVLRSYLINPVRVARDAPQALEALYGSNGTSAAGLHAPQLILMDAHVRKGDVAELVRRIRSEPATSHVPIIVLVSSEPERSYIAERLPGDCYAVVKPLDLTKLVDVLRESGAFWTLLESRTAEPVPSLGASARG